jgi:hypothetical protein
MPTDHGRMNGHAGRRTSSAAAAVQQLPLIDVVLSRPAYRLGSTIVGTIQLVSSAAADKNDSNGNGTGTNGDANDASTPLRSIVQSAVVYVAGFCRIDPRWHNVSNYSKMYGKVHPFLEDVYKKFDSDLLTQGGDETVCFWATNGLELLDLEERTVGAYEYANEDYDDDDADATTKNENTNSGTKSRQQQQQSLAFTFRVDLPTDLPHSTTNATTTCRYFYSAHVLVKTEHQQRVVKIPFVVLTNPDSAPPPPRQINNNNVMTSGRVKIGTCSGMAHSIGLPCHVAATEVHRPQGQMTVCSTPTTRPRSHELQTLRVSNGHGQPVCVLTVVGATKLMPGSRVHLKWDFPARASTTTTSSTPRWVPCHQVCACLQGQELAVYEDGTTQRTRNFVFDTCHELVEPGVTQRVSTTLLLPMDAPCTLQTDLMEFSVTLQVDITVQEEDTTGNVTTNGGSYSYNNLRLELPCHVVHGLKKEEEYYDEEETPVVPLDQLMYGSSSSPSYVVASGNYKRQADYFPTFDILSDLKIVSLQMEQSIRQRRNADAGTAAILLSGKGDRHAHRPMEPSQKE